MRYILCRYINISVSERRDEKYLACCSLSAASALFSAASADMTTARRYESRVEGRGLRRGRSFRTSETRGPQLAHHCARCIREREPISYRRRRTIAETHATKSREERRQWRSDANGGISRACAAARASGDSQWRMSLVEIWGVVGSMKGAKIEG